MEMLNKEVYAHLPGQAFMRKGSANSAVPLFKNFIFVFAVIVQI